MAKKDGPTGEERTVLLIVDLIAARDLLESGGTADAAAALIRDDKWRAVFVGLIASGELVVAVDG